MAVDVRVGSTKHDSFPKAERISVEDGHLIVLAHIEAGWQAVGAYPPKGWLDAKVETKD